MNLSPYALLCASKPKPQQATATDYDLFSLSQRDDSSISTPPVRIPDHHAPVQQAEDVSPSAKRTHYIADIHARHTSAMRRAPQSPGSL